LIEVQESTERRQKGEDKIRKEKKRKEKKRKENLFEASHKLPTSGILTGRHKY
jgi:hypothetical protein